MTLRRRLNADRRAACGTAAPDAHGKPGLPQLDISTFASQLFWLLISFVILYTVISRVAAPKIGGVIQDRANRIRGDLETAAKAKRDSEAAIAGYEKALADARTRGLKTSDELRNKVQAEINAKNDAVPGLEQQNRRV
jgi:F-type H+-transporting ATPase subunit b